MIYTESNARGYAPTTFKTSDMAKNESAFRLGFRNAVEDHYRRFAIWPNNDRFTSGIADLSAVLHGHYYPLEAKFVEKVPARDSMPILDHELTAGQYKFLERLGNAGASPGVLIGFPDSFLAIPFSKWPEMKNNITMTEALAFRDLGFEFKKIKGSYQVAGVFELLMRYSHV